MSNNASMDEEYRNLSDKRIELIINTLNDLQYTEKQFDSDILPYISQWLYDNYVAKESTCVIISSISNINRLQETIDDIYEGISGLPAKTHLHSFLTKDEYTKVEDVIEPRKNEGTLKGRIDDDVDIIINFKKKQILRSQSYMTAKGDSKAKITPIVEAVPDKLIVYDSPLLEQPRSFKIIWTSKVTNRNFITSGETMGATIPEISRYLIDAGYSHNPRLVEGALSCVINTLIINKLAVIKTDIDNPGFYYDPTNDKITAIKKEVRVPSLEQMAKCALWLDKLSMAYTGYTATLATVLKWCLMSEFSYAMKQAGDYMPWLYLKGTSKAGKTTLARIGLFIHGEPSTENDVGGTSIDTVARLGVKVSKSCDPLVVNEPASVFNRKSTKEMIKLCVESTLARSKYTGASYGGIPAFAPILFTANMYVPEDDAIINRLHVISFSYSQRKSNYEKKEFEHKFRVKSPHISPLRNLKFLGQFAATEVMGNPGVLLDDWKKTADNIISAFYEHIGTDVPEWLLKWEESESIGDLDDSQREDIRNFFVSEFNNARKKINVYDSYGNRSTSTLDVEEATTSEDFTDVNWGIVNNRMLTWAIPFTSRNGTKYVCLTQGLRKALGNYLSYCDDLKGIGELLGWNVKSVRVGDNKSVMKVIKVDFKEFMGFLYPNVNLEVFD